MDRDFSHPLPLVQFLIFHEGYHHGQIKLALKAAGWVAFLEWSIAAAVLLFALLSAASIGLFILPFALIACWLVTRDSRIWPELSAASLVLVAFCCSSHSATEIAFPVLEADPTFALHQAKLYRAVAGIQLHG